MIKLKEIIKDKLNYSVSIDLLCFIASLFYLIFYMPEKLTSIVGSKCVNRRSKKHSKINLSKIYF